MHVLFISNCELKATAKTRAILDRYATRIGRQAWTSPFTQDALDEVYKALSKTATRQTSVACYRNKSFDALKLVWIVGNLNHYDERGFFASETKQRAPYMPLYLQHCKDLAGLSGVTHDFGKATVRFDFKLKSSITYHSDIDNKKQKDRVRHEWISAWLLQKMNNDFSIESIQKAWKMWEENKFNEITTDKKWLPIISPVNDLKSALIFTVATHHRLFGHSKSTSRTTPPKQHCADFHVANNNEVDSQNDLLKTSVINWDAWKGVSNIATKKYEKLALIDTVTPEYWRGVALVARACLVLADHEISSREVKSKSYNGGGWANTIGSGKDRVLNQPLTWHLENVATQGESNVQMFAGNDLPSLSPQSIECISKRVSDGESNANLKPYLWQNIVTGFILENWKASIDKLPTLVFNLAGTGSGKTIGNVKILWALRPNGLRITAGFNLRTLTLQTRDAFIKKIGIVDADLACVVGGPVTEQLHDFALCDDEESVASNFKIVAKIDKKTLPEWLKNLHSKDQAGYQELLAPSVLVTTMDHLVDAGNPGRQASHALAMIRISNSDLIIDEADSYDPKGLMAVLRVIEIAAMFGRNIVISSATLPGVLADAIMRSWDSGRRVGQALGNGNGDRKLCVSNNIAPEIIDATNDLTSYGKYNQFTKKMADHISQADSAKQTKKFRVIHFTKSLNDKITEEMFVKRIHESARQLHNSNNMKATINGEEKSISIGMVRMANITPLMNVAKRLMNYENSEYEIRVMTYHAREVIARRFYKEKSLDSILNRTGDPQWWENSGEISDIVNNSKKKNIIFIVVASPVEEVGRDHDFDWAVIEPSSIISIIQCAGRVNRHRLLNVSGPNIHILSLNWMQIKEKEQHKYPCFSRPGFQIEDQKGNLTHLNAKSKSLSAFDLLNINESKIDVSSANVLKSQVLPMDIRLIFGNESEVCRFAQEDFKAIEICIKGAMLAIEDDKSWMNTWVYEQFPLREKDSSQETYSLRFENDEWKVTMDVKPKVKGKIKPDENNMPNFKVVTEVNEKNKNKMFFSPLMDEVQDKLIQNFIGSSSSEGSKNFMQKAIGEFSIFKDGKNKTTVSQWIIDEFGIIRN